MLVKSVKALHAGVSNYEPMQFEDLQKYCPISLIVNQMEFSVKATYNFFNGVADMVRLAKAVRGMAQRH